MKMSLKQIIAEIVHQGWKGFVSYIFGSVGKLQPDGSMVIPKATVDRWKKMMTVTHYKLNPGQKDWANNIADKIIKDIKSWKKRNTKTTADPRVNEMVGVFIEYCENLRNFKPEISAVDRKILKNMLTKYSVDEISDCFDWFLNNKDFRKFSPTISTILSAGIFNKFLSRD